MGRRRMQKGKGYLDRGTNFELGNETTTKKLAGVARRNFIAEALLVFSLTQMEIVDALEAAGHVNPDTGKPWSLGTVNRDVQALKAEWEQDTQKKFDEYLKGQLAKIQLAQSKAWSEGNLTEYGRFLEMEIRITGTGQRDRTNDLDGPSGNAWDVFKTLDSIAGRIEERRRLMGGETVDGETLE